MTAIAPVFLFAAFKKLDFFEQINYYSIQILNSLGGAEIYSYSQKFIGDYVTGILFVISLFYSKYLLLYVPNQSVQLIAKYKIDKGIQYLAGSTLSIYLYHFPLLLFFSVMLSLSPTSKLDNIILISLTFVTAFLLSRITESKKHVFLHYINLVFAYFRRERQ